MQPRGGGGGAKALNARAGGAVKEDHVICREQWMAEQQWMADTYGSTASSSRQGKTTVHAFAVTQSSVQRQRGVFQLDELDSDSRGRQFAQLAMTCRVAAAPSRAPAAAAGPRGGAREQLCRRARCGVGG